MNSFLFACLFVVAVGFAHADEPERIVGGVNAEPGEFPYMVSIRVGGFHYCGGAIIGQRHILTAAHCLVDLKGKGYEHIFVVAGSNSIKTGGKSYPVADMFFNPEYPTSHQWHNDVGVIKLAEPIAYDSVQQPIDLPTEPLDARSIVVVSGWGRTGNAIVGGRSPDLLQKILLKTITKDQCKKYYPTKRLYDNQICTLRKINFGTCNGDSGGPLAFGNQIHGIVSGGIPCALGLPDIFTSVYHHLQFIRQAMTY